MKKLVQMWWFYQLTMYIGINASTEEVMTAVKHLMRQTLDHLNPRALLQCNFIGHFHFLKISENTQKFWLLNAHLDDRYPAHMLVSQEHGMIYTANYGGSSFSTLTLGPRGEVIMMSMVLLLVILMLMMLVMLMMLMLERLNISVKYSFV